MSLAGFVQWASSNLITKQKDGLPNLPHLHKIGLSASFAEFLIGQKCCHVCTLQSLLGTLIQYHFHYVKCEFCAINYNTAKFL